MDRTQTCTTTELPSVVLKRMLRDHRRDALLVAINGTTMDRLRYVNGRQNMFAFMQTVLWGKFAKDEAAIQRQFLHWMERLDRLSRVSTRR